MPFWAERRIPGVALNIHLPHPPKPPHTVGFIASLANLEELSQVKGLTWLKPVADYNPQFTAFLQGFVPPLVLSIFFSLVPTFMVMLSRFECLPSESDAQAAAIWVRAWLPGHA